MAEDDGQALPGGLEHLEGSFQNGKSGDGCVSGESPHRHAAGAQRGREDRVGSRSVHHPLRLP